MNDIVKAVSAKKPPSPRALIPESQERLRADIRAALNRVSAENGSDTPDFILADYLLDCMRAFDAATAKRDGWYQFEPWADQPARKQDER